MRVEEIDHRGKYRFRVNRIAECRIGGSALRGQVLDEHNSGAFLGPPGKHPNPGFVQTGAFSKLVDVGDRIVLRYLNRWPIPATRKVAVLRWRGFSKAHLCYGYGLQFDND